MESSNNSSPLSGASSNFCYDTNVLLAHKAYVMKKFPEPQDQNGYPPVYMLDCETCKKKIGYKDKRIPRFMRDGQEGILSRDCSLSSIPGNEFSTRSIPTQRSVPREMSRRQKMADRIAARDSSKRSFRSQRSWEPEDEKAEKPWTGLPRRAHSTRDRTTDLDAFDSAPLVLPRGILDRNNSSRNIPRPNQPNHLLPKGLSDRRIPQFPPSTLSGRQLQSNDKKLVEDLHQTTTEDESPVMTIQITKKKTEGDLDTSDLTTDNNANTTDTNTDVGVNKPSSPVKVEPSARGRFLKNEVEESTRGRRSSASRGDSRERDARSVERLATPEEGGRGRTASRGRSESRGESASRGRSASVRSNASGKVFSSRKERAAFFIGLRSGSQSRSPSPWGRRKEGTGSHGNSRSGSPNPANRGGSRSQSVDYGAPLSFDNSSARRTSLDPPGKGRGRAHGLTGAGQPIGAPFVGLPSPPPGLSVQAPRDDVMPAKGVSTMSMEANHSGTPHETPHGSGSTNRQTADGSQILPVGRGSQSLRGRRETMDRLSLGRFAFNNNGGSSTSPSSGTGPGLSLSPQSRGSTAEAPEPVSFRRDNQFYGRDMTVSSPSVYSTGIDSRTTSLQSASGGKIPGFGGSGGFGARSAPPSRAPPPPPESPPMRPITPTSNEVVPVIDFGAMPASDVRRFSGEFRPMPEFGKRGASPSPVAQEKLTPKKLAFKKKAPGVDRMPSVDEDKMQSLHEGDDKDAALSQDEMALFLKLQKKLLGDGASKIDGEMIKSAKAPAQSPVPPGFDASEEASALGLNVSAPAFDMDSYGSQMDSSLPYGHSYDEFGMPVGRYDATQDPGYYPHDYGIPQRRSFEGKAESEWRSRFEGGHGSREYRPPPPEHAGSMSGSHSSHSINGSHSGFVPPPPPPGGTYNAPAYDRRGSYESPYGVPHHSLMDPSAQSRIPRHELTGRSSGGHPPPPPPPPGRRGSWEVRFHF